MIPSGPGVFHDPTHFADPSAFRPERFLDPDSGRFRPDERVLFGTGRRRCPGEALARAEQFLFLSNLVLRFRFEGEGGRRPTLDAVPGLVFSPVPFQCEISIRK